MFPSSDVDAMLSVEGIPSVLVSLALIFISIVARAGA